MLGDQLGVAQNGDVGVVGGEDELAAALLVTHLRHDHLGGQAVVEVVLGLVDHERRIRLEQ